MAEGSGPQPEVTRRELLLGAAAASVVAAAGSAQASPAAHAAGRGFDPPLPADEIPPPPVPLFDDFGLSFQCMFALGAASAQAAEFGEVATAVAAIRNRDEAYGAYFDEFRALAARVAHTADDARRRGRTVTARGAYLRAATYYGQALFFVLASARPTREHEGQVYRAMRRCWQRAGRLMDPPMENVALPWRGPNGPMPGWFLRPGGRQRRRPTLIMNNGSDAQAIDLWATGGMAALQRGWNVLMFDGPGQGAMLFERSQGFVPQWERVITPVVNWLRRRPEVDPDRIALQGWSFGGALVPRAAAFESRLAAIAVDPGVVDPSASWTTQLPAFMFEMLREGKRSELNTVWADYVRSTTPQNRFNLAKRLEIYRGRTFYDQLSQVVKFDYAADMGRVRCPALVLDNEVEQFFPGQAADLYRGLRRSPRKRFRTFTIAEGAQYHCEPMAPQIRNDAVMGWFEQIVN